MLVPRQRQTSVPALLRRLTPRHPELAKPVTLKEAHAIAAREGIRVSIVELPERINGRLMRVGQQVWINIARHVPERARHVRIMHELWHFWTDDPGVMCAYSDEESVIDASEEAADIFAWAVTSPAREYVLGRNSEW